MRAVAGPASTDVQPVTAATPAADDATDVSRSSSFANTPSPVGIGQQANDLSLNDRTASREQQQTEPRYSSDAGVGAPDLAHSKRSIAGLGMDQPGSASKRFRPAEADSSISELTQNFEGLNTGKATISVLTELLYSSVTNGCAMQNTNFECEVDLSDPVTWSRYEALNSASQCLLLTLWGWAIALQHAD